MRKLLIISSMALLLTGTGCGLLPEGTDNLEADVQQLEDLHEQIQEEIGVPRAELASQCKVIAFGSKPCGGPWEYLVYSTAQTDEGRLQHLVAAYNSLQQKINEEEGRASDCRFVTPPPVALEGGVCVIDPD